MTMNLENPLTLRVDLDETELLEYGLTFEQLDYEKSKTRQLLNFLLREASSAMGFRLRPGRMMIEAFPADKGGCIIYFTISRLAHRVFHRKENVPHLYAFEKINDLLDVLTITPKANRPQRSQLYKADNQWQLAVWGAIGPLDALLGEYSDSVYSGRADIRQIAEHGQLICQDPFNVMGPIFGGAEI